MRKPEKKWRKAVATGFLQAMTLIVLISAPVCHSQSEATACFPANDNPATDGGGCIELDLSPDEMPSMCGAVWAPKTTSTVYIRGNLPVGSSACPDVFLFATKLNSYGTGGGPDPYVSVTDFQYVSPTLAKFKLSIGEAPPGDSGIIQLFSEQPFIYFYHYAIWPASPPSAPGPSQPNCPTITLAPVTPGSPGTPSTPIFPNVWIAGVDNSIVIKGSGLTSQAVGDCIATLVTASLPGGPTGSETIPISNLKIVDDNTITAVVTPPASETGSQPAGQVRAARAIAAAAAPADSDTTETAYVTLSGTPTAEGDNSASATVQIVGCSTPTITSITPSTWLAGKIYSDVSLTGKDFITPSAATAACPATRVTVNSGSGKVSISSFQVTGATNITASIKSMADDRNEPVTVTVGTSPYTATTKAQITGCQLPTSEATTFLTWFSDLPTVGVWKVTLTNPSDISFSGVTLEEFNVDNFTDTQDTCYFKGSKYDPFNALPWEPDWRVYPDNTWYDQVGWNPGPVAYYRAQKRAPCGTSMRQQMAMSCLNDNADEYSFHNYGGVNTLVDSFTNTTVTSGRAGKQETKDY